MESINENRIRARVAGVYDTAHGSQGQTKSIKEYTGKLEKAVDIHTERMGSADDFKREFGAGI